MMSRVHFIYLAEIPTLHEDARLKSPTMLRYFDAILDQVAVGNCGTECIPSSGPISQLLKILASNFAMVAGETHKVCAVTVFVDALRMVRTGGRLAITTWGPDLFEPPNSAFWEAISIARPDLVKGFNPRERISTPAGLRAMRAEAGINEVEIVAQTENHPLNSPED
jgi:hypothetical protein